MGAPFAHRMRSLGTAVLALGLALGLAGTAQAVPIDNFDDDAGQVSLARTTVGTSSDGPATVPTGVIGQRRRTTLTLTLNPGGPPNEASARLNPPDNMISFSADSGVLASYDLFYGGPTGNDVGLFDADSDGTTGFAIFFVAADAGTTVTITLMNDGTTTSVSSPLVAPGAQTLFRAYAGGWSGGHAIGQGSFEDIDTITVTIAGAVSGDYIIDQFSTSGGTVIPEPSIPEPSTLLLLLGAVGFALAAGRRRCVKH
ncbi:MAG: PEP-CTERM sorting domain-containing protein [Burkholderiales bacterium]|nr:PEP-CTERM sorting domain-containing protein [Burkholderiales bacterium]